MQCSTVCYSAMKCNAFVVHNSMPVTASVTKATAVLGVMSVLRGTLATHTVSLVLAVLSAAPMKTSVFSASVK